IHDFLCLPEWTGSEVQEEPHLNVRSTLQRLPFYCTPSGAADAVISDPTLEDRAVGTPSSKILAKAKASQKSSLAQSSGSTTRPSLFVGDSDDESDGDNDACVEISLVTPLCFAAVIPSSGNQGGSSVAPATEDSWGKGIMIDDTVAPSIGKSQPRPSSQPAPSFRDVFGDAIHFPRPGEMVRVESFSDDQLAAKMSVLHCMMMSHGCELLARYCGLNQSHHEYVLSTDSRLKGYEEKSKAKGKERKKKIKSLTKSLDNLHVEVAHLSANLNQATVLEAKKDEEILRLKATSPDIVQGELLSLVVSAGFERGLNRLADASLLVAQTDYAFLNKISKHVAEPLSVILHIEPEKLARPANVPPSRDARVYPPTTKESSVTPASKSLELSANVDLTAFVVASEHNEDMVNAEVDGLNPNMTDDIVVAKSRHTFVQGISVALEDVVELVKVGSGCTL
ncbi:hypothetical protein Tco_0317791, partial [Tanacetum coccineum]